MKILVCALVAGLGVSTAAAKGKAPKMDVCHWSQPNKGFHVINVNENALDAHLGEHGDHLAGVFYFDADGDGYGDPAGPTDACANTGFVDNADDCDDSDASINPGAEEICGDGIDNNCANGVDEGCTICPCFDYGTLSGFYDQYLADDHDYKFRRCYHDETDRRRFRDYTRLELHGRTDTGPATELDDYIALEFDRRRHDGLRQCVTIEAHRTYDYSTGQFLENDVVVHANFAITAEEADACEAIILDWSADHDTVCDTETYYED